MRGYKGLSAVERAFRCIKGVDLKVRPIWLRTEAHVKSHVLLCVLAYHLEWHLRAAWAELLYADEELERSRATRDPVLPPETLASAQAEKASHVTTSGFGTQSFASLLGDLATLARNRSAIKGDPQGASFTLHTEPTPLQRRAMQLLGLYPIAEK